MTKKSDKPEPKKPAHKKVFDIVPPGKAPASPNSRNVIVGHKAKVKEDMFVPGKDKEPSRLAGDPNEKRPLMAGTDRKVLAPASNDLEPSAPAVRPPKKTEPAETKTVDAPGPTPAPTPEKQEEKPIAPPETTPPPAAKSEASKDESYDNLLESLQKDANAQAAKDEEATAGQLAVEQVVQTPDADTPSTPTESLQTPLKPLTQDEVLAETQAPVLDQAVVSHHKTHHGAGYWLLILLLIVVIALLALNFLLDAEVITIDFDVPHTNLIK